MLCFFWLNKTFYFSLNIRHAYLQVHLPFCQSQQGQQHRSLHLLNLRHQILLWQRPSFPMAPVCLSLSLWVALLMVLKSKIVWHFVYTEGLERWRIHCLRKYWTRSCHGFCRSACRPWIPIAVTKTTYGTSTFGYSWYFTNPSLFFFFSFFSFSSWWFQFWVVGLLRSCLVPMEMKGKDVKIKFGCSLDFFGHLNVVNLFTYFSV